MALYIPAGRRRRRLAITVGVTALISLLVGVAVGRLTAPTAADQARDARQVVAQITGRLNALPFHYAQAARGETDKATFDASLRAGLDRVDADLPVALDSAAWMDDAAKNAVRQKVAAVRQVAADGEPPEAFQSAVDAANGALAGIFGTPPPT